MTPIVFVSGVLLGTSASIFVGLLVVMLLFVLLGTDQPQVAEELPTLGKSALIFLVMTTITAFSFISALRNHAWRWTAQFLMWLAIVAVVIYYFR